MSDRLTPEVLLNAYANGIFPMSEGRDDPEVFWVDPRRRGIFPLDGFHISKSLAKQMRRGGFDVRLNSDFAQCVRHCADRDETWINDTIFELYCQLHHLGYAQSLEIWQDTQMVGGVYGVTLGGAFFGESMFSTRTGMSKIALAYLVDHLNLLGFTLFDTQFLTDHLASLGAIEIDRAAYHDRLAIAIKQDVSWRKNCSIPSAQDVIQRNTHTS